MRVLDHWITPYAAVVFIAIAAYGAILFSGAGFSHPDDLQVTHLQCCHFRPLLALSYAANHQVGGWILTNLLLHVSVSMLLLGFAGLWPAAIFAAHPMAADAVASVAGRSALLTAATVLFMVLLVRRWRALGWFLGPILIVAAIGFLPDQLERIDGAPSFVEHVQRWVAALGSYVVPNMAMPFNLSADPEIVYSRDAERFGWALLIGGLVIAYQSMCSRVRGGMLLLLLPLLPYAVLPLPDVFLEHRAYLSLAGFSILLCAIWKRPWPVVLLFVILANGRAAVYSSGVSLWEDAVRKSPNVARARVNLGALYGYAGRTSEARAQFLEAIRLNPDLDVARANLATIYVYEGNIGEASRVLDARKNLDRKVN